MIIKNVSQEVLVKLSNPTRKKGSFSTTMGLQMGEVDIISIVILSVISSHIPSSISAFSLQNVVGPLPCLPKLFSLPNHINNIMFLSIRVPRSVAGCSRRVEGDSSVVRRKMSSV